MNYPVRYLFALAVVLTVSFTDCPESNIISVTPARNISFNEVTDSAECRPDILVIVEKKSTENVDR